MAQDSSSKIDVSTNLEERFTQAYASLCEIQKSLSEASTELVNCIPDDFEICDALEILDKLNNLLSKVGTIPGDLMNILSTLTQIPNVDIAIDSSTDSSTDEQVNNGSSTNQSSGLGVYLAFQIICKRLEIMKLSAQKLMLMIEREVYKLNKKVLMGMLNGKGSTNTAPTSAANSAALATAQVANQILTVLSAILTMIQNLSIMNVNGGSCCFFMTPKSIQKTAITIANVNASLTNNIPQVVDEALTKAEESIKDANGKIKKAKIVAAGTTGGATAAAGQLMPTPFGSLDKFDPQIIRTAINAILQLVVDADPLPRYEKLSITNIRFLVYLATGFEPAAKQTFGIPGFP